MSMYEGTPSSRWMRRVSRQVSLLIFGIHAWLSFMAVNLSNKSVCLVSSECLWLIATRRSKKRCTSDDVIASSLFWGNFLLAFLMAAEFNLKMNKQEPIWIFFVSFLQIYDQSSFTYAQHIKIGCWLCALSSFLSGFGRVCVRIWVPSLIAYER